MKAYHFLFPLAVICIVASFVLAFGSPLRTGFQGDDIGCEEGSPQKTHLMLASYLLFEEPIGEEELNIGTCPYQHYYAKTYALELWVLAGVSVWLGSNSRKRATHTMPGSAI